MKILIFAGGVGTRFWPLSRKKLPKQFMNIIDNTSTFELAIKRVQPEFGWHNIFVSTNEKYIGLVKDLAPRISNLNIFAEPAKRDLGPAVGLAMMRLKKLGVHEPVALLWADHFMNDPKEFVNKLKRAEKMIYNKETKMVLVGETPHFANNNIGWIKVGKKLSEDAFKFDGFVYKPDVKECKKLFKSKKAFFNTGYIISTPEFILSLYEKHQPELYKDLSKIEKALDTSKESKVIDEVYPNIEPVHSDHCINYHLNKENTVVLRADIGWDDPGTLYALKKFIEKGEENVRKGKVHTHKCKDCLVYNFDKDKLVTGVELDGMVIVNTEDALLVVHKDKVREISDMIKSDEFKEKFKKYL